MKFIKLRSGEKRASEKWSKPEYRYDYHEIENISGIAIIPDKGIQVIDVDDEATMEVIDNILKETNQETLTLRTTKGKHYWFLTDKKTDGGAGKSTISALNVDYRNDSCYLMIKINGVNRVWSHPNKDTEGLLNAEKGAGMIWLNKNLMKPLPFFLIKSDRKLVSPVGFQEGDSRNDWFLKHYIKPIRQQGYSDKELISLVYIINNNVFLESLGEHEIKGILDNKKYRDNIKVKRHDNKDGLDNYLDPHRENKIKIAETIRDENNIRYYQGNFWILDKTTKSYRSIQEGETETNDYQLMIQNPIDANKKVHRDDIKRYLKSVSFMRPTDYGKNTMNIIGGYINYETEKFTPYKEDEFPIRGIYTTYNPKAYNKNVDDFLNQSMLNDKKLRLNIEEFIGSILFDKTTKYHTAMNWEGVGRNGKSTCIDMITALIGQEHISNLGPLEFAEKHNTVALVGKMLNICEETDAAAIKRSGTIKSVISGGVIPMNPKNETPFSARLNLKLIFCLNKQPSAVGEHNEGYWRRFRHIPWLNNLKENQVDRSLGTKLETESALQYLLNLAIQGWKRLEKNNGFTESDVISAKNKKVREQSNSVLMFIKGEWYDVFENAKTRTADDKGRISLGTVYAKYKKWCPTKGNMPMSETNFKIVLSQEGPEYGVELEEGVQVRWANRKLRYEVIKITDKKDQENIKAKLFIEENYGGF